MRLNEMTQNQLSLKLKSGRTLLESLRCEYSDVEIVLLLDSPKYNSFNKEFKESLSVAISSIFEEELRIVS